MIECILCTEIAALASVPTGISTGNRALLIPLVVALIFYAIALVFNRMGKIVTGGIVLICIVDLGFILSILGAPVLDLFHLSTFDLLIESVLLAAVLLPAAWIFGVALLNCLFIVLAILFQRHTPGLGHYLSTSLYNVIEKPLILEMIVAVVAFLFVRSITAALARAQQAEEIARLQDRIAQSDRLIVEQKRVLDEDMYQIIQFMAWWSNGNLATRIPIDPGRPLWQVAQTLNLFSTRLQQTVTAEKQLQVERQRRQQDEQAIAQLTIAVQKGQVKRWIPTGTQVDAAVNALQRAERVE